MRILKTSNYQNQLFDPNPNVEPARITPQIDINTVSDIGVFSDNLIENLDNLGQLNISLPDLFKRHNLPFQLNTFANNTHHYTVFTDNPIVVWEDGSHKDAQDWLFSLSDMEVYRLNPTPDFNEEFWKYPPEILYHGTTEEYFPIIKQQGLIPTRKTRGISNSHMPAAIFATPNIEEAKIYAYHGHVVSIHPKQMKQANFTPRVIQESPVEDAQALDALAHKIGLEEFHQDSEDGISPETVAFLQPIPPQFLSFSNPIDPPDPTNPNTPKKRASKISPTPPSPPMTNMTKTSETIHVLGITVLQNPTIQELETFAQKCTYIRGIATQKDVFFWNAHDAAHESLQDHLVDSIATLEFQVNYSFNRLHWFRVKNFDLYPPLAKLIHQSKNSTVDQSVHNFY